MYKQLSDSTLMNMSKKEIIKHLRIAEHNYTVCEEVIDQQVENFKMLLEKERQQYIDKVVEKLENKRNESRMFAKHIKTSYIRGCISGLDEAIEIVKEGGKE